MPLSSNTYLGNGSNRLFSVGFAYLSRDHVSVTIDDAPAPFAWIDSYTVSLNNIPPAGSVVRLTRTTPNAGPVVDFQDAATLTESDLDRAVSQTLFAVQEALDRADTATSLSNSALSQSNIARALAEQTPATARAEGASAARVEAASFLRQFIQTDGDFVAQPRNAVNAALFGVRGDGVTDNTAALNAALAAYNNIELPPGDIVVNGSLNVVKPCTIIIGAGRNSGGGSMIRFKHPTADCMVINGVRNVRLADFAIVNTGGGTGRGIVLEGSHSPTLSNVAVLQFGRCIDSIRSRAGDMTNVAATTKGLAGGYCFRLYGEFGDAGGIWNGRNLKFDSETKNEGDGLRIEGAVGTINIDSIQCVRCRYGIYVPLVADVRALARPAWLFITDFESDSTGTTGVQVECGMDFRITEGWVQGATDGPGVYIGRDVDGFLWDGRVGGGNQHGIVVAGKRTRINNATIARNSWATPGTHHGVYVTGTSSSTAILGGSLGRSENGSGGQGYGLVVEDGALAVTAIGVEFSGNLTGPLLNLGPGSRVIVRGCVGIDDNTQHVTAPGSGFVDLGNTNGVSLRAGNSVGPVVNSLRVAGGLAGGAVQLIAEGPEADISIRASPKGAGRFAIGPYSPATGLSVVGFIEVQDTTSGAMRKLAVLG
jgi:hypothetical protein